jgi:transcriptional regulator with XRE-family HTH domain
MSILGDRCRQRREELGLSQTQLGGMCGVKQQAIDALERGKTKRPKFLHELSKALGRPIEWLTGQNHELNGDTAPAASAAPHRVARTVNDIMAELDRVDKASIRAMRECLVGDKSALAQLHSHEEAARELRALLRNILDR